MTDPFGAPAAEPMVRAISLWQPWASAIALGYKTVETRHWSTNYRGPLVIHAAKRWTKEEREFAAIERACGRFPDGRLPLGALVAVADLIDVQPTWKLYPQVGPLDRRYGNYEDGRYGWLLANIRALDEPIGWRGGQGFFQVPASVLARTASPTPCAAHRGGEVAT